MDAGRFAKYFATILGTKALIRLAKGSWYHYPMSMFQRRIRLVPPTQAEKAAEQKLVIIAIALVVMFVSMTLAAYLHDAGVIRIDMPIRVLNFATPVLVLAFIVGMAWLGYVNHQRMVRFWTQVAESYGWSYAPRISVKGEQALLFKQGRARVGTHVLTGTLHELPLTLFQYRFTKGSGKSARVIAYTVFEFTFKGRFPHLYLNYKHNYNPSFFELLRLPRVALPVGFEEYFTLYVPQQYEIEALELFTPDTLAFLLDKRWRYDVEMMDNRMLVFARPSSGSAEQFMEELERVSVLVRHLEQKLHRASFEPIGDLPHKL